MFETEFLASCEVVQMERLAGRRDRKSMDDLSNGGTRPALDYLVTGYWVAQYRERLYWRALICRCRYPDLAPFPLDVSAPASENALKS
jgi:hypothetical protein